MADFLQIPTTINVVSNLNSAFTYLLLARKKKQTIIDDKVERSD